MLFAPTFVHGEGVGFAIRSGLLELLGFRTFMKPINAEFVKFIEKHGFQVIEHERIGSKVAPLCCLIAKK